MKNPYDVPGMRRPSAAPLVEGIRAEVDPWRQQGYPGSSPTSRRLLEHWFLDEHETEPGIPFRYYFAQREAVETLVYLAEVVKARSTGALIARYAQHEVAAAGERHPRYVVKMATGSGKTKVMSLAIAWSYFHALREPDSPLTGTALLIAPNLIVYERLREDFENGAIFRDDPVIPPEWRSDFDMVVCLKGDPVPRSAQGVLAVTNIQALHERPAAASHNPVDALLGRRPPAKLTAPAPLLEQVAARGRVLVVDDEAHHLHDQVRADTGEPLVAIQTVRRLHELASGGVAAQLDFSATPRDQQGRLFAETVCDYPLASAVEDGIVKRPIIGELSGALEVPSADAAVRFRQRIDAGVARWRQFREQFARTDRKPLLFVMAEDTPSADQIAAYLETLSDLTGRVLTIHVNLRGRDAGEISKADLAKAREFARQVDRGDSPYEAIVSVLMLREGWDVRNVTVIVPLRAYTAKARILPEQTLGRGLRRMTPPDSGFDERLVVIDHQAFRDLWDEALESEGLEIDREAADQIRLDATVIAVEPERMAYDIEIPLLPRLVSRSPGGLAGLRVENVPARHLTLPTELRSETIDYTGRDLLSGEVVERAEYPVPFADDPGAVLAWYVNEIQRDARLTGQFAVLAPIVRGWLERRAFGGPVDVGDPLVLQVLGEPSTRETIIAVFRQALDEATLSTRPISSETGKTLRLSATKPFLWSGEVASVQRSVFSGQPCDSGFEIVFAGFLDRCTDVAAFGKLAREVRFSLEYRGEQGRLAYYYPDFVVRGVDGHHFVLETKGIVDVEVPRKDERARRWAADATSASGVRWRYERIDQDLFEAYAAEVGTIGGLLDVVAARRRAAALAALPRGRKRSREELVEIMDRTTAKTVGITGVDEAIREIRDQRRVT